MTSAAEEDDVWARLMALTERREFDARNSYLLSRRFSLGGRRIEDFELGPNSGLRPAAPSTRDQDQETSDGSTQ